MNPHSFEDILCKDSALLTDAERAVMAAVMILGNTAVYGKLSHQDIFESLVAEYHAQLGPKANIC